MGSKLKYILFIFTSLKYSNVRLPPNKNRTGSTPNPMALRSISISLNVFRFTFRFFTAKTLYGIREDINRWVKLQVLYPNKSKPVPAGVELVFLAEAKRILISKSVTKSSLNFWIFTSSSIYFTVNFGNDEDYSNYFNDRTTSVSWSLMQSIKTFYLIDF